MLTAHQVPGVHIEEVHEGHEATHDGQNPIVEEPDDGELMRTCLAWQLFMACFIGCVMLCMLPRVCRLIFL